MTVAPEDAITRLGQTNQPKDLWESGDLVQLDLVSHATQPVSNVPTRVKVDVRCDLPPINAGLRSPIHQVEGQQGHVTVDVSPS